METTAFNFWKNVDKALGNRTLVELAEQAEMSYNTIKGQRSANRYPTLTDSYKLAVSLDTTVEMLLTGFDDRSICLEAKAVQQDPNLQALVRAVERDPHLIPLIGALVESAERTMKDA